MNYINKYLRNFSPYKLASHKIWTVEPAERSKILKLDWNESVLSPSPKVIERLRELVLNDNIFYNYYPSTYNHELLRLLSEYVGLPEENIQYFAGSDSLHEYIGKLYISVGDPVLLLGPTYDNFRLTAEVCGADIYYHYLDEQFVFDAEEFEERIRVVEPSLVYICNPNNPTGTQHTAAYIRKLLNEFPQTLFLIDEAYVEFAEETAKELVLEYENILISRTMSKAFGLANFRLGYLIASKANIEYISSIRNPKNISTFAQEAAIGALSDIDYMRRYVSEVIEAKQEFVEHLSICAHDLQCVFGGGNFVLLILNSEAEKCELIDYLMARDIYVRELSQTEFLSKRCVRVTVGTKDKMDIVASAILSFFGKSYEEHCVD